MEDEETSTIKDALMNQSEGVGPNSDILMKIGESLCLKSNQEILIESVALEKLKENAEQVGKTKAAQYVDQMVALTIRMHEHHLTMINQSQNCSPVPVPSDFLCPLSLELMRDPVIVSSGQTYERFFIKKWVDLGLTVCPKTRQTLAHPNLIPNYNVKQLKSNWCELHNVKLSDPMAAVSLNSPSTPGNREYGENTELPVKLNSFGEIEDSLPSAAENRHCLDISRVSLSNSDDPSAHLEEKSTDPVGQPSISPQSQTDRLNSFEAEQPDRNNRTATVSSVISSFPQETSRDAATGAARKVKSEPHDAPSLTDPNREQDFPPSFVEKRSRINTMWRRPSDRFATRIISSAIETVPDLFKIEAQVKKLIDDLKSNSLGTLRDVTAEIRLLSKHNMDNRIIIAKCGAINILVDLLRSIDTEIQENAVTALLNLSIDDNNKSAIVQADAIEHLINVLETGSPEAKENSSATLFSLSVIEDNKIRIGRSRAIVPLVDLLGNGTPRGKRDAATALFNLSLSHENKARIVQAGAVKHLVKLMHPATGMVDKAVTVLANLATIFEGRTAIGHEGGIPVLVEVVELGSARGKENAVAALLQLCTNSSRFNSLVLQEGAIPPLVALLLSGTPRAKGKAQSLLSYFRNCRHGNVGRS